MDHNQKRKTDYYHFPKFAHYIVSVHFIITFILEIDCKIQFLWGALKTDFYHVIVNK